MRIKPDKNSEKQLPNSKFKYTEIKTKQEQQQTEV